MLKFFNNQSGLRVFNVELKRSYYTERKKKMTGIHFEFDREY